MKERDGGKGRNAAFDEYFKQGVPRRKEELMERFGLSRSSVDRRLKSDRALTSINAKGRFHVPLSMAKFNRHGLAEIEGKIFSRHGNLLKTIVGLVEASPSGLTPVEIESLTRTNVQSQCLVLFQKGALRRVKIGKSYRYYSADPQRRGEQMSATAPATSSGDSGFDSEKEGVESLREAVMIPVTCLRNPGFSPKSVALSLTRKGFRVTTAKAREVFAKYDLAKKKS